jgi:hypothetical protein
MGQRFFWLPWALKPDLVAAVGTTSRIDSSPGQGHPMGLLPTGDYSGDGSRCWYSNERTAPMKAFAVTRDPDRVPLTQVSMKHQFTLASTNKPVYSPFYANNWASAVAYRRPGEIMESNSTWGPFPQFRHYQPYAFFVYEMQGVSSITGSLFLDQTYSFSNPAPRWGIGRRLAADSSFLYLGWSPTWFWSGTFGPIGAYVLRPSTGAVVGWIYQEFITGGYGATGRIQNTPTTAPSRYYDSARTYGFAYRGDVTGIQDGDLIVWEWWSISGFECGGARAGYWPTMPYTYTVAMEHLICGGSSGQPLTIAGDGYPNWAPSWGAANIASFGGIEPNKPRNPDLSFSG